MKLKSYLSFGLDKRPPTAIDLEKERLALLDASDTYLKVKALEAHYDKFHKLYNHLALVTLAVAGAWVTFTQEFYSEGPLKPILFILAAGISYASVIGLLDIDRKRVRAWAKKYKLQHTAVKPCPPENILELYECARGNVDVERYLKSLCRPPVMGEYLMLFRHSRTCKVLARKKIEQGKAGAIVASWVKEGEQRGQC